MALRKKEVSFDRSMSRKDYTREYYGDDANRFLIVIKNVPQETTSYRFFFKDGSPGWLYQKAQDNTKVSLNQFLDDHGLDPAEFRKIDCSTTVQMFTTFLPEKLELELDDEANLLSFTAKLWIPGFDTRIEFCGEQGMTEEIAWSRFLHKFNIEYPGCTIKKG